MAPTEKFTKLSTSILALLLTSCVSSLSGTLLDKTGAPITTVELERGQSGQINATRLSSGDQGREEGEGTKFHVTALKSDGTFRFDSLEEGLYLIEAIVPGYAITSQRQEVRKGDEITLTLTPLEGVNAKTIRFRSAVDADKGAGSATLTPPHL